MMKAIKQKKEEQAIEEHDIKVHEITVHEIKRMILKEGIGKVQSAEVDLKQKHFEEVLRKVDGKSTYLLVEKKITTQSVAAA